MEVLDEEDLEKFREKYLANPDVKKKLEDKNKGFSKFFESFEKNIDIDP